MLNWSAPLWKFVEKKKSWLNPSASSSFKRVCASSSYSAQQQANLIPGLNLNALGIFSSGLPVLPPAAGPRGAVPPVAPAGYNPFLVSVTFFFTALNHQRRRKKEMKNPCFRMTLPPLSFLPCQQNNTLLLKGYVSTCCSNLFPTHGKPGSPWSAFRKNNTVLTQVFLPDVVHKSETTRIPPSSPEMSQFVCKTKSPLTPGLRTSQSGVRQSVRMYVRAS